MVASRRRRRDDPPARAETGDTALRVRFVRSGETLVEGYAIDPADPERRLVVELLLDGYPTALARAALFDREALATGLGDGCHGFRFALDAAALPGLSRAELRLANLDLALAPPIALAGDAPLAATGAPPAQVEWRGGLSLSGWVEAAGEPGRTRTVEAWAEGAPVARAFADRWRMVAAGDTERPVAGFRLTLPRTLADGRPREIDVTADGKPLPGGALTILAFPDGLALDLAARAEAEADAPRGAFFDALLPDQVPFGAFEAWDARFAEVRLDPPEPGRLALLAVGLGDGDASLASLGEERAGAAAAILPPNGGPASFDPAAARLFLEGDASDCDFVLWLRAGVRLRPGALARLVAALDADAGASLAYGDLLLEGDDGALQPLAFPAFDYERFLEQSGPDRAFLMRRSEACEALERGVASLHRLFVSPVEAGHHRLGRMLHVPGFAVVSPWPAAKAEAEAMQAEVAAHLRARGIEADIRPRPAATLPAVRVRRKGATPSVALILDADDPTLAIREAAEALRPARAAGSVSLFVSAPVLDPALREALRLDGVEVFQSGSGRSRAARLNAAADAVRADTLCFVDARLRPATPDWLDELVARLREADMGAIAPMVRNADGAVVEAGRLLSPLGVSLSPFQGLEGGDPAYGDALVTARQVSGLGWQGFLTRRSEFLALGGFDALLFPHHFGAHDYALKLQAFGRRVLVTPDAVLLADRTMPAPRGDSAREARAMLARWPGVAAADPFHNPQLARGAPFHGGLAWPPGLCRPRRSQVPPARAVPPGWW
ncbi:glycosyltransferase family 2 protein (plasmid) [Aureimonas ureilytica]|uniref:glycosyltransferase family 2 protein n=1 Tax=Aureimonas ureilytica TaxID=401562 RepID=UPI003CE6786A